MYVQKILLKNFRNYHHLEMEFSPSINFITGGNGAGKTNVLEAISILSHIRSFRNIHDSEIIKWGEDSYYCSLVAGDHHFSRFEVGCLLQPERIKKRAKIDGKEIGSVSEYFGKFLCVIFSPLDINIIQGNPEVRRRFFDSVISKIDISYLTALGEFKKILSNRNRILKDLKDHKRKNYQELEIWDDLFCNKASLVVEKRKNFTDRFNMVFGKSYNDIAENDESPSVKYKGNLESADYHVLLNSLHESRKRDLFLGTTTIGPQRDDYLFENGANINFNNYASQGQKRTAAISLKISESAILEEERQEKAVILVDDIFSELDDKRRLGMIDLLNISNQVIFTMVHMNTVDLSRFKNYKTFRIDPGAIVVPL